jgi:serine/threonine protein kinase
VVALKQSQAGDNGQIRREARIGAGLHHPNVVTVFDAVLDSDDRWLVMEYLPSRNLSTIMAENGPLSPADTARIGGQIAGALVAMHQRGMVHRDIKPGNVLVTEDGVAKLTDMGIARWADETGTGNGELIGTPGYFAPEVADGYQANAAADVYSLGATLFAAVEGFSPTGRSEDGPFAHLRRAAAGELEPPELAGPLAPVLTELLQKDPGRRPSARKAKELLDEIAGNSVPLTPLPKPRISRKRIGLTLGAAAVVLALVAVGSIYIFRGESSSAPPMAGTVGDKRTADPCALLDQSSMTRFGVMTTLDSEYGYFNRCGMLIKQTREDDSDLVDLQLMILGPPEYPTQPHTLGQLGQVERFPERDGKCARAVRLADGNQVEISVSHKENKPAPLCGIAEAAMNDAYAVLSRGEIPRRAPFPPGSLGTVDACSLLTSEDIAKAVGVAGLKPEPDFGNFICYWGTDPIEVDIELDRDWPQEPGPDGDGELIKVGSRDAYYEVRKSGDDGGDNCVVEVVHRKYQKNSAWHNDWVEVASVGVETEDGGPREQLCAKAIELAKAMVDRLPPV